jgi:hypothetical protein
MSRRKGETAGRMNERAFPHLVELAVPPRGFQEQDLEFEAFHRERGIHIRGGSGGQERGQFYIRFCFPSAALAYAFRDRFGGLYLTSAAEKPGQWDPLKKRSGPKYEPRVFGGRVVLPDELERIHKEIVTLERIDSVSNEMRELIEDLWPELLHKPPPKEP